MDTRHRKKKFNSISSILSKPDASGTSKGFGCRVRFPIYSCALVKGKENEDGDEGEIKGMEVVSFKEVKRGELKLESEASKNKNGEPLGDISNKISVSSGTCFLLFSDNFLMHIYNCLFHLILFFFLFQKIKKKINP